MGAAVAAGAALLAVSAMAHGIGTPAGESLSPPHLSDSSILLAQADAARVLKPATYTEEQAQHGEEQFTKHCVECHGEDLKGGLLGGPPLRGLTFESQLHLRGSAGRRVVRVHEHHDAA